MISSEATTRFEIRIFAKCDFVVRCILWADCISFDNPEGIWLGSLVVRSRPEDSRFETQFHCRTTVYVGQMQTKSFDVVDETSSLAGAMRKFEEGVAGSGVVLVI
ncbi:hypothetical protein AVEN_144646-1 [Araneus ventricosus]|uniref:Uncharacterized protein n=1 Tax=Araneus ventricosus TaxID=182803 RepID=A0A4Y2E2K3_ARAVE|nr:hypothetical protein AVEN_144646-1 [Araneus ventricosus]